MMMMMMMMIMMMMMRMTMMTSTTMPDAPPLQLRELALMNGTLREEEYLTMVKGRVSNYGTPQIPGDGQMLPAGGSTAPWKPAMVPGGDASLPGACVMRDG